MLTEVSIDTLFVFCLGGGEQVKNSVQRKGANNIHFACTYINSGKIYKKLIKPGDSTWIDGRI